VTSGGNFALKIAKGESNVFVSSMSWVTGSNGGGPRRKAVFRNVAYKTLQQVHKQPFRQAYPY
jgi:hypothetical protein